jgi:ribosome-associated protein
MAVSFAVHTAYIKLDSFLKAVDAVSSGGEAKFLIADGQVRVNGVVELRRGRKLYPGDKVKSADQEFSVERADSI